MGGAGGRRVVLGVLLHEGHGAALGVADLRVAAGAVALGDDRCQDRERALEVVQAQREAAVVELRAVTQQVLSSVLKTVTLYVLGSVARCRRAARCLAL